MAEKNKILKVHPNDNVLVALQDLSEGQRVTYNGIDYVLLEPIAAKHKFTTVAIAKDEDIIMYGVLVGKAKIDLPVGVRIATENIRHASDGFKLGERRTAWQLPSIDKWKDRKFLGYHRNDGSVGTGNYWLVVPLVFCENRNIDVLKEALLEELGYARPKKYHQFTQQLAQSYRSGASIEETIFEEAVLLHYLANSIH